MHLHTTGKSTGYKSPRNNHHPANRVRRYPDACNSRQHRDRSLGLCILPYIPAVIVIILGIILIASALFAPDSDEWDRMGAMMLFMIGVGVIGIGIAIAVLTMFVIIITQSMKHCKRNRVVQG